MDVAGLFDPILKILLISLRAGALWMFFPVFGQATVPAPVRLAGALTLSVALLPLAGPHMPAWTLARPPETGVAVLFLIRELGIGMGMGLVSRWFFSSSMSAAHWVGQQMGFSMGGVIDPEFGSHDTSWAQFHQWISVMMFFAVGGHVFLIQAIADSYSIDFTFFFRNVANPEIGGRFWSEVGFGFFTWMLRLAGPLAAVLLLLQGALGILSRFVPQINVWTVSIPITIGAGVLVMVLLSPMYGDALGALFTVEREYAYIFMRAMGTR
jgi:flagellar biosynthetic protein FliR